MKKITSLAQVTEIALNMFNSDSAIISLNIETIFGLVTVRRDGAIVMAK
jgi:hypothetical protein